MASLAQQPALIAALAVALFAAATDLRARIVPNRLVAAGLCAGVLLQVWTSGVPGLVQALAGAVVGFAVLLPFYLLGGMGAGDVKLMAALGACLGAVGVMRVALVASLLGAVVALAVAARRGLLRRSLVRTGRLLASWLRRGPRPDPALTLDAPGALTIPYALPIAVGAFLCVLVQP